MLSHVVHCLFRVWFESETPERATLFYLVIYALKLDHKVAEATKIIYCDKGEGESDQSTLTKCWELFFSFVARTSTIRYNQISLKSWIPRLCSEPERQNCWRASGEYLTSSISHSSMWFFIFTTSAKKKKTGSAKLWLKLQKYSLPSRLGL